MKMKVLIPALAIYAVCGIQLSFATESTGIDNRDIKFNDNWTFSLGDYPEAKNADYNDNSWNKLSLPHDWSIRLNFDKDTPAGNDGGYLPAGIGWYRKKINIPLDKLKRKHQLYFEGAYMNSQIFVNGNLAGENPYGYSSFFVDISPFLNAGDNFIAVRVDNSMQKNCRWFSGSGIFRNVWLRETADTHIANWGVAITTPTLNSATVITTVENESDITRNLQLETVIDGNVKTTSVTLAPGERSEVKQDFHIPEALPWSPEAPNLYKAIVSVKENGETIDSSTETFGFRTIEWSADKGFLLNGNQLLINGSCAHHDNGILGAAAYDRAEFRRAQLLKEAGFNAVRTSHNIPSEAFLNACDQVGLMVIDEAFDGWRDPKNEHDYHTLFDSNWRNDLDVMIMRDRNHPSVICWSIGNEVIERDKIEVVMTAGKLADRCRELDPTRPVTSALANWGKVWETYDPLADQHDIVGYNYTIHESENDHNRNPLRVMWQTESYPKDAWDNYLKAAENTYIIGDFVWTGMDYIGESGIGRWYYEGDVPGEHFERPLFPWHASYCGDIDLTGTRKPISHYRSMLWNKDGEHLFIAVREPDNYIGNVRTTMWGTWPTFQSWNWPGHEGKDIDVEVYSHYPSVRLFLDDTLIGEKETEKMMAVFTIPYAPGTLRAEGISNGASCESTTLSTAGDVASLRIVPDRTQLSADSSDLSFISIELIDRDGNLVPIADNEITVTVSGNASLAALGNADIKETDPYFDSNHKAWKGRALAVVRPNGKRGNACVKVSSPGLETQSFKINCK